MAGDDGIDRDAELAQSPKLTDSNTPYDMAVDPVVDALGTGRLEYLSTTVRDLIAKRIEGIHYAESRRTQLLVIGGALAAVGVALVSLSLSIRPTSIRWTIVAAAVSSLGVSLATWLTYLWQTNYPYPFIDPAQSWKWFYHHALPDKEKFGPKHLWYSSKKEREAEKDEYAQQWDTFRRQVNGLSNPRVDATQDVKQLYLLHVDERYKNLFLSQLRKVLSRGVVAIAAVSLLVLLGTSLQSANMGSRDASRVSSGNLQFDSAWKPTGSVRRSGISETDLQFFLTLTITNEGPDPYVSSRVFAEDRDGKPIFVELDGMSGRLMAKAGHSSTFSGRFWIAAEDSRRLARFKVT